jgi:hypothetical protein
VMTLLINVTYEAWMIWDLEHYINNIKFLMNCDSWSLNDL